MKYQKIVFEVGESAGIRTLDLLIKSQDGIPVRTCIYFVILNDVLCVRKNVCAGGGDLKAFRSMFTEMLLSQSELQSGTGSLMWRLAWPIV